MFSFSCDGWSNLQTQRLWNNGSSYLINTHISCVLAGERILGPVHLTVADLEVPHGAPPPPQCLPFTLLVLHRTLLIFSVSFLLLVGLASFFDGFKRVSISAVQSCSVSCWGDWGKGVTVCGLAGQHWENPISNKQTRIYPIVMSWCRQRQSLLSLLHRAHLCHCQHPFLRAHSRLTPCYRLFPASPPSSYCFHLSYDNSEFLSVP